MLYVFVNIDKIYSFWRSWYETKYFCFPGGIDFMLFWEDEKKIIFKVRSYNQVKESLESNVKGGGWRIVFHYFWEKEG